MHAPGGRDLPTSRGGQYLSILRSGIPYLFATCFCLIAEDDACAMRADINWETIEHHDAMEGAANKSIKGASGGLTNLIGSHYLPSVLYLTALSNLREQRQWSIVCGAGTCAIVLGNQSLDLSRLK